MGSPGKPLQGVRVLLVEDDQDTRELFQLVLEDVGAEARSARDGDEAMLILLEWRPNIVVSDMELPGMDGPTLLAKMRSLGEVPVIPAIAMSGHSSGKARESALGAGFRELLVKPVERGRLVAAIERWASPPSAVV